MTTCRIVCVWEYASSYEIKVHYPDISCRKLKFIFYAVSGRGEKVMFGVKGLRRCNREKFRRSLGVWTGSSIGEERRETVNENSDERGLEGDTFEWK